MRAILAAALLVFATVAVAPAASASSAPDCIGIVPQTLCYVGGNVDRCTPPTILSTCYVNLITSTLDYAVYLCNEVLGPGTCIR